MWSAFFHTVLYQPLFNAFVGLYNVVPGHDVGLVILVLTILIRLVVYPLTASSIKSQRSLQELQPKMEEIKKLYAKDPQKQAQATMELYKSNKINPFSSCLPLLVQLPILIALYWVMRDALNSSFDIAAPLYSFVANPGKINAVSFGWFDFAKPNIVLAVFAGLAQFIQTKTLSRKIAPPTAGSGAKDENMVATMNKQMLYIMPAMTVFIGMSMPAGLTWYWFWSTILMAGQQLIMMRKKDEKAGPNLPKEGEAITGEVVKK